MLISCMNFVFWVSIIIVETRNLSQRCRRVSRQRRLASRLYMHNSYLDSATPEIGDDLVITSPRLQAKHPGAAIWTETIGFNAVYAIGGTLIRTAQ